MDLPRLAEKKMPERINVFCPECGATLEVEQRDPIRLRAVHEHEEVAQTLAAVWRDWR